MRHDKNKQIYLMRLLKKNLTITNERRGEAEVAWERILQ